MNDLSEIIKMIDEDEEKLSKALTEKREKALKSSMKNTEKVLIEDENIMRKSTKKLRQRIWNKMTDSLLGGLIVASAISGILFGVNQIQMKRLSTATEKLNQVKVELESLDQWGVEILQEEDQLYIVLPKTMTIDLEYMYQVEDREALRLIRK